jgi:hypothetical protein
VRSQLLSSLPLRFELKLSLLILTVNLNGTSYVIKSALEPHGR